MAHDVGFDEDDLRARAGSRSFQRGLGYLDAVAGLEVGDGWITARVQGTDVYEVELALDGDRGVLGDCACPYGQEGHFCKHCVAVGLTVLRQAEAIPRQRAAAAARADALEAWLRALSREELLTLLREQLADDRELRRRLELRATAARSDLGTIRDRVLALLDPRPFARYGYVEYADAHAYARQAQEVVAALRTLAADGRPADAAALTREAIEALCRTYEEIDDSDGAVAEVASRLAEAHLEACRAARPDPDDVARWLVGHLLGDLGDAVDIDVYDYREVLGEAGLARVRHLATEAWQRKPSGWAEQYLMERLVKAEGDVDALVAVYAADLSPTGATHLRIAEELDAAGRDEEALQWAERGVKAACKAPNFDGRLADYVCARYTRAGRTDKVVAVRRDRFRAHRSLDAYQQLRTAAKAADRWDRERETALEALREDARRQRHGRYGGPVLIDALLDDGDLDAAWRAAHDGADEKQWLTLADRSADTHPADALTVYLRLIEPLKKTTGDRAYQQMARLLLGARACHRELGTQQEFTEYLAALRTDQKRKRNLMKILDQHGL
ncbi:SWIM zinc finger family protein [Streptomyces sp. BPTC-684]|uniref:SWIM zinc finger family protein n=1 Tax=Streptomyces sp. BPTC-684 TaxID=3043734 RepID=UPI0024B040B2|nr:SWIM zinc finger family protein [Streptomyces sp. BPTC-684]WHM40809.1 hypothetical protein QIY60_30650 [Streptomyces sp. BPTC-684]